MTRIFCRAILASLVLVVVGGPPVADVRLILTDGQVLEGKDVRRDTTGYLLTLEGGGLVPIPEELVKQVELSGEGEEEKSAEEWPPTGLKDAEPKQLAGYPDTPPIPSQQTEALGDPAKFQRGVFDPNWHPKSDWKDNPSDPGRNDFAPSTWAEPVVDPNWVPQNAYPDDKVDFAPSTFQGNVIDPNWVPKDGFKKS